MMSAPVLLVLLGCVLVLVGLQAQTISQGHEEEEDLRVLVKQLSARVKILEEREDGGRSQVAFSASLVNTTEWTNQGPFADAIPLVFRRVTTNIGNAYDPDTGVFTVPVRGLYYLSFTGVVGNSGSLNAALLKNDQVMFAIFNTGGKHSSATNSMTLELQEGDRVWITMWHQHSIFDQSRLSTFSGFLVFPLEG
ncbi:complement C1q tumor necrosis factor-related protein 3-like [Mugil cephalus]|uniref:complement C1q tumor necrosis factor-related protein 3-like n=1 Tax=Mugil cephalus TaxID=48193 RepID=UPI001FB62790|nr:complement C1q tumor necrosis factor-related protein 3-like [Mugil cephalus]